MRARRRTVYRALVGTLLALMLGVRTADAAGITERPGHGARPGAKSKCNLNGPLVYMQSTPGGNGYLQVFMQQGQLFTYCYQTALPSGGYAPLYVDQAENVYLIEYTSIEEFAKGGTQLKRTLTQSDGALDIAVDTDGTVYSSQSNSSTVEVYAPGSNTPTSQLDAGCNEAGGIALDNQHVLYVATNCGLTVIAPASKQSASLPSSEHFQWMQTTAGGAIAGCTTSGNCGLLSGPGPGKISNWRLIFYGGDFNGFVLFPGEQYALVNLYNRGGGVYGWPGPDQGPLQTITDGDIEVPGGVAVSPADPLGAPFYLFSHTPNGPK